MDVAFVFPQIIAGFHRILSRYSIAVRIVAFCSVRQDGMSFYYYAFVLILTHGNRAWGAAWFRFSETCVQTSCFSSASVPASAAMVEKGSSYWFFVAFKQILPKL